MSDKQPELDFPATMIRVPGDTEIIRDYTGSFKVAEDWNEYERLFDEGWRLTQEEAIEAFETRADGPNMDYLRKRAAAVGITHIANMKPETLMEKIAAAEEARDSGKKPKGGTGKGGDEPAAP